MKKIDFHTHYLTPGLIKFLGRHFDGLSDGTPTPNWSMEKSPTGKDHWPKRTIDTMLSNEKYTGNVVVGKTYGLD